MWKRGQVLEMTRVVLRVLIRDHYRDRVSQAEIQTLHSSGAPLLVQRDHGKKVCGPLTYSTQHCSERRDVCQRMLSAGV